MIVGRFIIYPANVLYMAHNYDCLWGRVREVGGGGGEGGRRKGIFSGVLRILHKGSVLVYPKEGGLRGLILCRGTTEQDSCVHFQRTQQHNYLE